MKLSWCKFLIKNLVIIVCTLSHCVAFAATNPEGIQVYQQNLHLSAEHKQKLADDIYRFQTADSMWDVIRREFVLPHYENNPQVQEQIIWFLNHKDFLLNTMTRAAPYLYFILQQTHKRHLPAELVLLPMIESGYNPFAYSSMGASGLWQMMPGTASGFGIKQDWWYDGRRDVVASTKAALDYLTYLGGFFEGNWALAIAAYDTGEGNVLSAIKRNIREGKNTDFWSLPLAQETQIYVPRLLALATIISHPRDYPIQYPEVRNAPYLAQVDIGGQIDLKNAAELAGLSFKNLKQLNPGYNRSVTDPKGPFKLVLPIENVEQFSENIARSPLYQSVKWTRYKVRSGDTLATIAKRFKTSKTSLRQANPKLAENLKPGKHLVIPSPELSKTLLDTKQSFFESTDVEKIDSPEPPKEMTAPKERTTTQIIASALENFEGKYTLQPGDTLYMVRNNDDIEKIAKRFHITPKTLVTINQLDNDGHVRPGDKLIIPTHLASEDTTQKFQLTPGDTIYMVRKGENLEKIAEKFHTTEIAIRIANLLADNYVSEGDKLVIPTHKS
ncbi:MAG: lytic transglycosylase [Gammaproteobacteria bacterium]